MLFAVNAAHNGVLKSEPSGRGKWHALPASNDYIPWPSGAKRPHSDEGKECDWSRLSLKRKSNQFIQSSLSCNCARLFEVFRVEEECLLFPFRWTDQFLLHTVISGLSKSCDCAVSLFCGWMTYSTYLLEHHVLKGTYFHKVLLSALSHMFDCLRSVRALNSDKHNLECGSVGGSRLDSK